MKIFVPTPVTEQLLALMNDHQTYLVHIIGDKYEQVNKGWLSRRLGYKVLWEVEITRQMIFDAITAAGTRAGVKDHWNEESKAVMQLFNPLSRPHPGKESMVDKIPLPECTFSLGTDFELCFVKKPEMEIVKSHFRVNMLHRYTPGITTMEATNHNSDGAIAETIDFYIHQKPLTGV